MAEGIPTKLQDGVQSSGQVLTSASFTPTANALLFAHFHGRDTAAPTQSVISDTAGLTWTSINQGNFNSTNRAGVWWALAPASPSAMTVSVDWGAVIQGSSFGIFEVTGVHATTPLLAGTTAGATGNSTTPAPGTVPTITAGNTQILWSSSRAGSSTPEAGWTELYDRNSGANNCQVAAYYNTAGDTTPTCTVGSAQWRAACAELAAADSSLTLTPLGSEMTAASGTGTVSQVYSAWNALRIRWS